jgi:hypothetical protein
MKKILLSQPPQGPLKDVESLFKGQGINLNLCFFTFLPMSEEELDELEEIYEHYLFDEEWQSEDLTTELNSKDLDFLRRNGIRF